MKKNIKYLIICALSLGMFSSCSEEDLEPTLATSKSIETSINTAEDLENIIAGAYDYMSQMEYYGRDVIIIGEVRSDNATSNANSNRFLVEAANSFTSESALPRTTWSRIYQVIASANIVIGAEGLEGDENRIEHLKGQAYALRALAHFDLVRLYGQQHVNGGGLSAAGVPYVDEFRGEDLFPPRNSVQEVRDFAYDDLDMATSLMDPALDGSAEFITYYAADAIKARIAAYFGDWNIAEEAAGNVVNSGEYSIASADSFEATFATDNAANSIFEIAMNTIDNRGINGLANIYQDTNYGDAVGAPNLAGIYDEDDVRGPGGMITIQDDGTVRNTGKYSTLGTWDDNVSIIRYEEIVLIYAEALLENGNEEEALEYLNMIPENRNADTYSAATKENILLERRKELAFEGFRFDDLARTGQDVTAPDGIITHGGIEYGDFNYAMPLPFAEVSTNSNLTQNAGYN